MHPAHQYGEVAQLAQHAPDGRRDVRRLQRRSGQLVEQGLEQVVVSLVDQRDPHRGAPQMIEAAEELAERRGQVSQRLVAEALQRDGGEILGQSQAIQALR